MDVSGLGELNRVRTGCGGMDSKSKTKSKSDPESKIVQINSIEAAKMEAREAVVKQEPASEAKPFVISRDEIPSRYRAMQAKERRS